VRTPLFSGTKLGGNKSWNFGYLGDQYLRAAVILAQGDESPPPDWMIDLRMSLNLSGADRPKWLAVQLPIFFCIAHSAELYFKSFFAHLRLAPSQNPPRNDFAVAVERAWKRHLLKNLMQLAQERGLGISDTAVTVLTDVADTNEKHELRFQDSRAMLEFPSMSESLSAVAALRSAVEQHRALNDAPSSVKRDG
jgi:hypothetical protein